MTVTQADFAGHLKRQDLNVFPPTIQERSGPKAVVANDVKMAFRSGSELYPVLQGIDLEIQQGDIQLLMGPSGSGKTTLLSILAGILTPTEGKVWLIDQEITAMSRDRLAQFRLEHIGFIFRVLICFQHSLLPKMLKWR